MRGGEKAEYRINAIEQYQLTLWRYGLKKEYVKMIGWMDEHGPQANRQILPDADFTQTGVAMEQAGLLVSATCHRARTLRLVLFLGQNSFRRVLFLSVGSGAPQAPKRKSRSWHPQTPGMPTTISVAAVTTSTPTNCPIAPLSIRGRISTDTKTPPHSGRGRPKDEEYHPLSFDRPEPNNHMFDDPEPADPVQGRVQCGQAPGEWRLYAWLEREGFEYDLYAEGHLHEGKLPLDSYDVLIIAVHPEYWSREMYLAVKNWVFERGGRLMYLGGNGLNCEVTISPDG